MLVGPVPAQPVPRGVLFVHGQVVSEAQLRSAELGERPRVVELWTVYPRGRRKARPADGCSLNSGRVGAMLDDLEEERSNAARRYIRPQAYGKIGSNWVDRDKIHSMESFSARLAVLRFFDATVSYEVALWARVELAVADACGIKLGSFSALRVIAERKGQSRVQDAAADLGITIGAVSKIVDRLERHGYVRRRPNASDRRSSLIEVTAGGAEVLNRGLQVMTDELQAHLQPVLTQAQLGESARMLEDLTEACIIGERRSAS